MQTHTCISEVCVQDYFLIDSASWSNIFLAANFGDLIGHPNICLMISYTRTARQLLRIYVTKSHQIQGVSALNILVVFETNKNYSGLTGAGMTVVQF